MHISILAGTHTRMLENLLKNKDNFEIYSNEDISAGLKEIDYTIDTDLILISDAAFVKEGRQLDIADVLSVLKKMANADKNRKILLITKNEDLATHFEGIMMDCSNAKHYKVEKINAKVLLDCIFSRYTEKKPEAPESILPPDPEPTPQPIPTPEPEPIPVPAPTPKSVPEPEPEPEIVPSSPTPATFITNDADEEDVQEKPKAKAKIKPKKKEKIKPEPTSEEPPAMDKGGIFGGKTKVTNTLPRNKIIVITGNPNSGVTSTACNMASLFAKSGYSTLLMDFDAYCKGVNMYFDVLDTPQSNRTQGAGLHEALEDLETFDAAKIGVSKNLYLIGVRSNVIPEKITPVYYDDLLASDLVQYAALEFDVTLVHIPLSELIKMPNMIKAADHVVYCTECTINGISRIDAVLNPENYGNASKRRDAQILTKKTSFLLCNYVANSVNYNNFQDTLLLVSEYESICRPLIGFIPRVNKFDDFKTVKSLLSDKKAVGNLVEAMQNMYKV